MSKLELVNKALMETAGPVQSPFLPGTNIQFAFDSTSLGLLKTCPRLYQYTMIEGWASKDESVHLRFGIEFHQALQEYDVACAEGDSSGQALHNTVKALLVRTAGWEVDETTRAGKYKNRRSLLRTVVDYLDHYRDDPATTFILADGRPAVELSFRFELDWGPGGRYIPDEETKAAIIAEGKEPNQPYLLSGHLDRVVSFNDALFVMDRKTTTTTPSQYYFNQYEPNNQMTLYTLASKVILKSPIKGVIIDAAQILVDSSRFVRGFTYRTPDQLDEWTNDLRFWFAQAEYYAEADYWPQNDTACGLYGGCRFRDVCSKSPTVRSAFLKSGFIKQTPEDRWNPLKPR